MDPLDPGKEQHVPGQKVVYESTLDLRVRYNIYDVQAQIKVLDETFKDPNYLTNENMRLVSDCIWQAVPAETPLYDENEISIEYGMRGMEQFNGSQKKAIKNACLKRVSLIQGPPGTGKTKVLAAIVANLHK